MMEISGERECLDCGEQWSYFETRQIECPECGSIKSMSISESELDTASSRKNELDMSDLYTEFQTDFMNALTQAGDRSREYIASTGFIEGGELRPPMLRYVMAREIMEIADYIDLSLDTDISASEERYIIDLVKGVKSGDPPDKRPNSMNNHHYMAVAKTAEEYATELFKYFEQNSEDIPEGLEKARSLAKKTKATNGESADAKKSLRILRDLQRSLER